MAPFRPLLRLVTLAYRAGADRALEGLRASLADPDRAQREILRRFLAANARSAYGRAHGFGQLDGVEQFQARVPAVDYDALEPWIRRVAGGEPDVLTAEPAVMLERTGGSSGAAKLVPYTRSSLAEFSSAASAWLADLFRTYPALGSARQYWSISQVVRRAERTAGGIPIGIEDDTEYFGPFARWGMRKLMAVPADVAHAETMDAWRTATLLHLLAAEDLGLISVWSPTFLTVLMDALAELLPELLRELPPARAAQISRALDAKGELVGEALWPKLQVISCWADASAAGFIPALRAYFPSTPLQPKGLLATEGVVSIPLGSAPGAVLAVGSHFLEFIDVERPGEAPLLASQLREGGAYSPLLTTGAGLCRYHLQDIVRCVGHIGRTPLVRFEGRLDRVSDLAGEKLHERQVSAALEKAIAQTGCACEFTLLAPARTPPGYELFVESDGDRATLEKLAARLDAELCASPSYQYARELGQLAPVQVRRVTHGWLTYSKRLIAAGQRAGDIKPTHLDLRPGWAEAFGAARSQRRSSS